MIKFKLLLSLTLVLILSGFKIFGIPATIDNHIKIDQFGYPCNGQKIAVISNPKTGYNSSAAFSPGTGTNNYQVRRWSDDGIVFSGTIVAWNGGATDAQSGDQVWWFDFSSLTTFGSYYVYDVTNAVASYQFDISNTVYNNVLAASVRMFYYQRCGIAKTAANAGAGWADGICHNHASNQDANCMLYSSPSNTATAKNLSGGWHDAGDYNKYVNFAWGDLIDLLLAYSESPSVWTDNYNIPESGNGIPDLLDEAKWELDWLLKMQQSDGSVLAMVGNACSGGSGSTSPPSSDANQRVYGPATTSASLSAACVFALGAIQYKAVGMTAYANTLQTAAINSWNWAVANPNITWSNNSGTCYIVSGEQETDTYGRLSRQLGAAAFLFQLTGNATYKTYFESNYTQTHLIQWGYAYIFETTIQDILVYYASLPGITASVATAIQTAYTNSIKTGNTDNLPSFLSQSDAYRAYLATNNYTWGSNHTKAAQGNMFLSMNAYGLDAANASNYLNAGSGFIHYLHGVNPNALTYFTNMSGYNAENSITSLFHTWFADGSALWDQVGVSTYGPAPGLLSGGPNPGYSLDGCCPGSCGGSNALCNTAQVTPPVGQPAQKSYKDWNTSWPQDSWSVTEPDIGYQATYVRLLSKYMGGSCTGLPLTWLGFEVRKQTNNSALLSWTTANETNVSNFQVERSTDGINFEIVGRTVANGHSSVSSYSFVDILPEQSTVYYYRIKEIDINGLNSYTNVDLLTIGGTYSLFPNPTSNKVDILFPENSGTNTYIELYNHLGQQLIESTIISSNPFTMDISKYSPGVYLLKVISSNGVFVEKIIKN
jgi:endoglucanase